MVNAKTFEIGLVMAGAISAGSYTAGVIDFLIHALDAWEGEKQKERDEKKNRA
jgi:predicted patatin/cPLA2 family phospholipase